MQKRDIFCRQYEMLCKCNPSEKKNDKGLNNVTIMISC